jgi:hypothetical protein
MDSLVKRGTQTEDVWELARIFGPVGDKVTGGWKEFHFEEFHNLYTSLNVIVMINSSNFRWAEYVAAFKRNVAQNVLVGKVQE